MCALQRVCQQKTIMKTRILGTRRVYQSLTALSRGVNYPVLNLEQLFGNQLCLTKPSVRKCRK